MDEDVSARVLVADDEDDIRALVCLAVDVSMPGSTGLEVCTALRADPGTADIRILLLSAGASPDDVACGLAAGAGADLANPFGIAGLVHQVRALTARPPA